MISRAMPQGDILGFAPPLCLTRREADTIVGRDPRGHGDL
ncbi:adenosylmethionine-8-amino-7-oxononanoate aminotransferase [Amorphus orientalis]|uniref:Adenosylmethionine-8-amino-7-oxononanoate aminotransferase n=1 Tax=Amorphus orientalis TaxID=649198 RepID=A0AAE3VR88_9HYPH|nr:adenosylmethionine-8-amino-7-oxononanoate aminotransferase [Amorphus orientalis]